MATSEAAICNVALARISSTALIDSLGDPTNEARLCAALYPSARDALLSLAPWPFARRRAVLSPLAGVSRSGWAYAFALPADYLAAPAMWASSQQPVWAIEENAATGRILLANEAVPELVYTAKITDPTRFPPLFADALAWSLAGDLALALAGKADLEVLARRRFSELLDRARGEAAREGREPPLPDSPLVTARW